MTHDTSVSGERKRSILIIAWIAAAVGLGGCRSGISFNGQNVHDTLTKLNQPKVTDIVPPVGTPVEIPGILGASRSYFQTRSVINLDITSDTIQSGDSLELDNLTTQQTLVSQPTLALGLTEGVPFALTDNSYSITLSIYPMDPSYTGKFVYGSNQLKLKVNDKTKSEFSQNSINLKDFTFFGAGATVFSGGGAQRQQGFQGRVTGLVLPIADNGTSVLTTGLIGMSNW